MSAAEGLYAPDAREQLRRWDAGQSIWSLEMGGLGPGYEQAIQVLAIEIVRDELAKPLLVAATAPNDWGDSAVHRLGKDCGGFSGAQVGAAKWLAYKWLTEGPAALMARAKEKAKEEGEDRSIQVSRAWPRAPEPGEAAR